MTTPDPQSAPTLLSRHAQSVDAHLNTFLSSLPQTPPRLLESITYSLTAGGKRLRPALVLEFASATSLLTRNSELGTRNSTGNWELTTGNLPLSAAAAIELIHTFSLVHDDLPAMDDDDLRRGRPTNHKVFGEALAILAGDAMTTLAFQLLSQLHAGVERSAAPDSSQLLSLIQELSTASGPQGMIGGQVLDIQSENTQLTLHELQHLHQMKTGALLRAACRMGVIAAGGSDTLLSAATAYGTHLGLAFQITDDLLDLTSTPQALGKATHKDSAKGKNTYPSLLGLEAARHQAQLEITAAVSSLDPFGPAADGLRSLAHFVATRTT